MGSHWGGVIMIYPPPHPTPYMWLHPLACSHGRAMTPDSSLGPDAADPPPVLYSGPGQQGCASAGRFLTVALPSVGVALAM